MRRSDPAPAAFSVSASDHKPLQPPAKSRVVQFDWSRRWKRDVVPHLNLSLVRASVEMGMKMYDPDWTWDDGPHAIGRGRWNGQRVFENKLSWYQPWGRCHWIGFFACAVGVLNYPDLDWQFVCGHCHTVPVGSRGGRPGVVMDILNFKGMTAEESLAHARYVPPGQAAEAAPGWAKLFGYYVTEFVPVLRKMAC
ncbi:MAG: hypothetical protein U0804_22235 [Gemmataceae bacterium]